MNFKIDENFPIETKEFLIQRGHGCHSVYDEGIGGGPDEKLIELCLTEHRTLITMDLDFADIVAYPPDDYSGIVVFRVSHQNSIYVLRRLSEVMSTLEVLELRGHLVIVDDSRVRYR